jgi:hypothetical protein
MYGREWGKLSKQIVGYNRTEAAASVPFIQLKILAHWISGKANDPWSPVDS